MRFKSLKLFFSIILYVLGGLAVSFVVHKTTALAFDDGPDITFFNVFQDLKANRDQDYKDTIGPDYFGSRDDIGFLRKAYDQAANSVGTGPPTVIHFSATSPDDCKDSDCYQIWQYTHGANRQQEIQNNWAESLGYLQAMAKDLRTNHDKIDGDTTYFSVTASKFFLNAEGISQIDRIKNDFTLINREAVVLHKILVIANTPKPSGGNWRDNQDQFEFTAFDYQAWNGKKPQYDLFRFLKPSNLSDVLVNGTDLDWISGGYTAYADLAGFGADFKLIQDFVNNEANFGGHDISTAITYDAMVANFSGVANGIAQNQANGTTGVKSALGPCGNARGLLDIVQSLQVAFCGLSVLGYETSVRVLNESANLLANVSDMLPRATNNLQTKATAFIFNTQFGQFLSMPIEQELVNTDPGSFGPVVRDANSRVLQLVNIVLVLAFLLIALANILQIQINNYAVKKIVPGLIIGFLVAQASFFLVRASLEVSGQVTRAILQVGVSGPAGQNGGFQGFVNAFSGFPQGIDAIAGPGGRTKAYMTTDPNKGTDVDMLKVFKLTLLTIFVTIAAVMLLILGFYLFLRRFVMFFLTPLAPLAFMGLFFPPLRTVWTRWWKTFSSWILMPLAAGFWLWLAMLWYGATQNTSSGYTQIIGYVFGVLALYLAIKTPSLMAAEAKDLVNQWSKIGSKVGKSTTSTAKNAALSYTPAGAVVRGINQYKALRKQNEEEILKGSIVKNRLGRRFGGNTINRFANRQDIKSKQRAGEQKELAAEVEKGAAEQVSTGMLRTAAGRLARVQVVQASADAAAQPLLHWAQTQRSKYQSVIKDIGRGGQIATEEVEDRWKALERNARWVGMGGVLKRMTYGGREDDVRHAKAEADRSEKAANRVMAEGFSKGRGDEKQSRYRANLTMDAEADKSSEERIRKQEKAMAAVENIATEANRRHTTMDPTTRTTPPSVAPRGAPAGTRGYVSGGNIPSGSTREGQKIRAQRYEVNSQVRDRINKDAARPTERNDMHRQVFEGVNALGQSYYTPLNTADNKRDAVDATIDLVNLYTDVANAQDEADFIGSLERLLEILPATPTNLSTDIQTIIAAPTGFGSATLLNQGKTQFKRTEAGARLKQIQDNPAENFI